LHQVGRMSQAGTMTEYRKMKQTKEKRLNDWRDDEEVDERTGCWISIPKAARPTNRHDAMDRRTVGAGRICDYGCDSLAGVGVPMMCRGMVRAGAIVVGVGGEVRKVAACVLLKRVSSTVPAHCEWLPGPRYAANIRLAVRRRGSMQTLL
jgi:hypothetical protein